MRQNSTKWSSRLINAVKMATTYAVCSTQMNSLVNALQIEQGSQLESSVETKLAQGGVAQMEGSMAQVSVESAVQSSISDQDSLRLSLMQMAAENDGVITIPLTKIENGSLDQISSETTLEGAEDTELAQAEAISLFLQEDEPQLSQVQDQ